MTFTIKIRGGRGPMLGEYECPVHGRFELVVDRDEAGDPPGEAPCPAETPSDDDLEARCGRPSPWRISMPAVHTKFVVTASKGKNAPKPHAYSMDTRMLAEGRRNDFRKQRKKIREELRHKRVKELLR